MFTCFGWAVLRSSARDIDEVGDARLAEAVDDYLAAHFGSWTGWFTANVARDLNCAGPCLTLMVSRNHRHESLVDLFRWIARNGPGSYGLLYVRDDEDHNRGCGYENCFRVWRLARGKLTEHDDPFLSPVIPTVEDRFEFDSTPPPESVDPNTRGRS